MDLHKKIEEIRKKPEHIRMRYVWGCVIASILVIFSFWVFSVKNNFGHLGSSFSSPSSPFTELTTNLKETSSDSINSISASLEEFKELESLIEQEKGEESSSSE